MANYKKKYPKKLIDAYINMKEKKFSEASHKEYQKEAKKFLKKSWEVKIEQCKLVVALAGATFENKEKYCPVHPKYKGIRKPKSKCSICKEIYDEKQKEKEKTKENKNKKLDSSGSMEKTQRPNERQKKRKIKKNMQKEN